MGRHRRSKVVLGARSTVVKAAAAMGVATALAAGINSAANGPSGTQATADTTGDPVNFAGDTPDSSVGHNTTGASHQESSPTGFATQSAGMPKLIQQVSLKHTDQPVKALTQAQSADTPAPVSSPVAAQPSTPPPAGGSSTGATPPSSQPTTPQAPPQQGGTGSTGHQGGGGLLGGVIGTVGGVVDGLLG